MLLKSIQFSIDSQKIKMFERKPVMKKMFPEYQKKSTDELQNMLEQAIIVFDTNVLLNLYRYSEDTRNALKRVIEWCGDRLFMPYQVGYEYYNRRLEVIEEQTKHREHIEQELNRELDKIASQCRSFSNFYNIVKKDFEKLKDKIETEDKKREHFEHKDTVLTFLEKVFHQKVGANFSGEEYKSLDKEAQERVNKKIPPAYKDREKNNGNQYGDFYIWKQMIKEAKVKGKDLIFITEDVKEDWWYIVGGKTIGPRIELLREFIKETNGKSFQMYRTEEFIKHINNKLEEKVSSSVSNEIKNMTTIIIQNDKESKKNTEEDKVYYLNVLKKMYDSSYLEDIKLDANETELETNILLYYLYKQLENKEKYQIKNPYNKLKTILEKKK